MLIDTIEFNTYLPKECNGYDKHFDLNYDPIKKELSMDYKSEREHFIIIFDRDEIGNIDNFIKRFANYGEEESKTITKPLKEFTNTELHTICYNHRMHGGHCGTCPLDFITRGLEDEDCCVIRNKRGWIWRFEDYRNFFTRLCLYGDREISVKESDLKDG